MTSTRNIVAYIVQAVGIAILAINLFRALGSVQLVGGLAFDIFMQGVIYGALFLGFGEVIKLLQGLFNQREPEGAVKEPMTAGGYRVLQDTDERTVSDEKKNRIKEYYTKNNLDFDDVEVTPYEGYVIVHRNGKRDIVDLNGFRPEILSDAEVGRHPDLKDL